MDAAFDRILLAAEEMDDIERVGEVSRFCLVASALMCVLT